ncbi:MAG: hypothetical protein AB1646_07715 [Thermodesulfobacteriota bacterium]
MKAVGLRTIPWACMLAIGLLEVPTLPVTALALRDEPVARSGRLRPEQVQATQYREHEVMSLLQLPPASNHWVRPLRPKSPPVLSGTTVRTRSRLADAHQGLKFYDPRRCDPCHSDQTHGVHTVRANLTCRQCHGPEPIAGIQHHFSPINPLRRHSAVCAKCHHGAGESFAEFVIHEPSPSSSGAKTRFASLYYAYWLMFILFVGTMALFIPLCLLVGVRELLVKQAEPKKSHHNAD